MDKNSDCIKNTNNFGSLNGSVRSRLLSMDDLENKSIESTFKNL